MPHAGGGQDSRVHQARVDAHHVNPGIHGDPVRDTAAVPAVVGLEGLFAPHVDVGGRIGGQHAHLLRRVVGSQGAVTPAYRAVALVHLHRRGIDLQDDSNAVARRSYHPIATPSIDADLPRVYNPTFLLFTGVRGRAIWKIAEGLSTVLLRRQEATDRDCFDPFVRLRNPSFGAHPDFPNSFRRGILRTSRRASFGTTVEC